MERDELMWQQRYRVQWLKEGDRKTSYFHSKASSRREKKKKRKIDEIKNEEGEGLSGTRLDNHIVNYFKSLFSASTDKGPMEFLSNLKNRVSEQIFGELSQEYTANEVKLMLKQMHPSKTPGPDRMPPLFYQGRLWGQQSQRPG